MLLQSAMSSARYALPVGVALPVVSIQGKSQMKVLVIGGTGHVGSEVVKELNKRDADVRVLVRKPDVKSPGENPGFAAKQSTATRSTGCGGRLAQFPLHQGDQGPKREHELF